MALCLALSCLGYFCRVQSRLVPHGLGLLWLHHSLSALGALRLCNVGHSRGSDMTLSVILMSISLMSNNTEHLFMPLLAIGSSSFVKSLCVRLLPVLKLRLSFVIDL